MDFLNTDSCTFEIDFKLNALVVSTSTLYDVINFSDNFLQSSNDFQHLMGLGLLHQSS